MWYLVRGVEYSTNFRFFIENQICVVRDQQGTHFNSRLEGKCFISKGKMSDKEEVNQCREIHIEILMGKHGVGNITV